MFLSQVLLIKREFTIILKNRIKIQEQPIPVQNPPNKMSSLLPEGGQEDLVMDIIKYPLRGFQQVQSKQQKIPKILPKNLLFFIHITNEGLEFREVARSNINHLSTEEELSYEQILNMSRLADSIDYDQIIKFEKRTHKFQNNNHHLVGVYDNRKDTLDKNKTNYVLRLSTEEKVNQFLEEVGKKLKQQKQYLKKSAVNFMGIEQNIRKMIQKIMISSYSKRQLYNRICSKLADKKITLTSYQNKMMIYALMGNHQQMQNFVRKQRIESYDIEKKKYDDLLKQQSLTNMVQLAQPGRQHIIQGYSQKRKLDGVVMKRTQKQHKQQNYIQDQQFMYISKIPERTQRQIDQLIGIEVDNKNPMQDEQKLEKQLPHSYRAQKIKIPVKQYSIVSKQVERVQKQQIPLPENLDRWLLVTIEAVKFMYQLMKANSRQRVMYSLIEGPMDRVLDCLKDVLTQCERRPEDKKPIENKSVIELLNKANRNYLEYRRNPNKFY